MITKAELRLPLVNENSPGKQKVLYSVLHD